MKTIDLDEIENYDSEDEDKPSMVQLTKTDDNFAVVGKYYLQWVLLIFIHVSVFWYFPNKVNTIIQGHSYCDFENETAKNCNEVR